ncbi:acyltransferase family protein [Ornithinimicrobium cryptoxanthini]|uniref:acyltransferase family protein n=1 Tax=Ornithinimicrobium cryptoxanthini TaxID=2934161 RepID=UPI0021196C76|nr:acyltransferase family protein [Ornithinimicrobium cryptoxanthini]
MSPSARRRAGFRQDIEGLRAVSVLAVVLWHAGLPWLPGGYVGVDVFFVISGFLMTTILVTELERDGTIKLAAFYARRARRLLPAALAALLGTAILSLTLLPSHRWPDIGRDIAASAAYVVNWTLAGGSVDYLAQDQAPSPLQHFWSLAVEEQFYIVWPVLLLLVPVIFRRRLRGGVVAVTAVAFVSSLAYSIYLTAANPSVAYFVTPTRIWELALGGFVALGAAEWHHLRRSVARVGGWLGLAMILLAIVTYSETTPFPGWQALLPTVGAALVLMAGPAAGRHGPIIALRPPPMQFLGKISYSLYLWHWPLLVVAMQLLGDGHQVPLVAGLSVAALSVVPAWLSWKYVEEPVRAAGSRFSRLTLTRRSLRLGFNCSLAGLIAGSAVFLAAGPQVPDESPSWVLPEAVQVVRDPFGAMVLGDDPIESEAGVAVDVVEAMDPPLDALEADLPAYQPEGCHVGLTATKPGFCEAGDPDGAILVVLVGDSHAGQWLTAMDLLGRANGWRIGMMTKSSCPFVDGVDIQRAGATYWQCLDWNDAVRADLLTMEPDLVLSSHASYGIDPGAMAEGLERAIAPLEAVGIRVGVIRDVPRADENMRHCMLENPQELTRCSFSRESGLARAGTGQIALIALRPDLPLIDLTDYICPLETCSPVIGGVPVYRDSNHLSATYVRSLSSHLAALVLPLVPSDPVR